MKKQKEDVPLQYFERSYLWMVICIAVTAALAFFVYRLIEDVSPWAFIAGIPALLMLFQTLWLILNPYAIIYEDKFEIKQSVIHNKTWYYIDIKNVSEANGAGFDITYNDDDREKISTTGIRASHRNEFRNTVNKYVCKSLVERD